METNASKKPTSANIDHSFSKGGQGAVPRRRGLGVVQNPSKSPFIKGRLDRDKKKIITVRARWTSENGAQFDKLFYYELVSTQAYGAESLAVISLEDKK